MTRRRLGEWVSVLVVPGLLAACYSYRPVTTTPTPDTHLALVLNDQGRVGAGNYVGPATTRVEGTLVQATDTGYLLRVSAVQGISGKRQRWTGETVTLRRDYVADVLERRFSPGRTVVAVLGFAGTTVALVVTQGLGVLGGGDETRRPPPDGGNEQ